MVGGSLRILRLLPSLKLVACSSDPFDSQILYSINTYFKRYRLFVFLHRILNFEFLLFNATFSNISAISWRPVLVMEEAGVSGPSLFVLLPYLYGENLTNPYEESVAQ
jgi:hypothetical protein